MKVKAVRLHGANDLRLDEFELPEILPCGLNRNDSDIGIHIGIHKITPSYSPSWLLSQS